MKKTLSLIFVLFFTLVLWSQDKFTAINISYPAKVIIKYDTDWSVKITDTVRSRTKILFFSDLEQEDSLDVNFKVYVSNDTLYVKAKGYVDYIDDRLYITITTPKIYSITVESAAYLRITGNFNLDSLRINNYGASSILVDKNVIVRNIYIENDGAGMIRLLNNKPINYAKVEISGAGIFRTENTSINFFDAVIDGASYCSVDVNNSLVAKISGFSVLVYGKEPKYKKIKSDGLVIIHKK